MDGGFGKEMKISEFILARRSKKDDIPGTVENTTEKKCPVCGRFMRKYKPCCGEPKGYIGCRLCGWKEDG